MSNKVILSKITAHGALDRNRELHDDGLAMGQDYTWRYQPVKYNNDWSTHPIEESQVVFEFSSPALASFYRVKWAK
jgi:hypothetical protein